mgnify:CR=1 FL=1
MKKLGIEGKALFLLKEISPQIKLAGRNIPDLSIKTVEEVNAMDLLRNEKLLLTPSALEGLMERIKK